MTDASEPMLIDISKKDEPRPLSRHASLYFGDGDLIVSATSKDGETVLFRVHTAILGQFSPVFRDMLSFPEGAAGGEAYDSTPLVHLYDDPDDVSDFIDALYHSGCVAAFPWFSLHLTD